MSRTSSISSSVCRFGTVWHGLANCDEKTEVNRGLSAKKPDHF